MSGRDEWPGKRKEDNTNFGFTSLFKRIPELLRGRGLKFGIFDKQSIGLGVLFMAMFLIYLPSSPNSAFLYLLLYLGVFSLCTGCMKYERS